MKKIKVLIRKFLFAVVVLPITFVGIIIAVIGYGIIAITIGLFEDIEFARSFLDYIHESFMKGFSEKDN